MSVILDALQKARRDNIREGHDGYAILDAPTPALRKRRSRLVTFFLLLTVLVVGCGIAAGFYYLSVRLNGGHPFNFRQTASATPGSSYAAMAGGQQRLGEDELPQPGMLNGNTGGLSSRKRMNERAALDELPAPVPMHELAPEADATLPPPPVPMKMQELGSKKAMQVASAKQKPATSGGFVLGSILYDDADPMAVVNGITVRQNQDYGDFKVLKIYPSKVVVQKPGEKPLALTR